ncbi:MAG: DUF790 family protein [Myxococcota bacterium]
MLGSDLVVATVRGKTITPVRADRDDPEVLALAERIVDGFRAAAEVRGRIGEIATELEDAAREHPADHGGPKLARGLVKIAQDRCTAETAVDLDPPALRRDVFLRAAARGPLGLPDDPFGRPTAGQLLDEVGTERGVSGEAVGEALYGDLPTERRIEAFDVPSAAWLVDRYDTALVQGLLLAATELRIVLDAPTAPRMRQLVRWVKFHQLLHTARRVGDRLELVLDGPMSVFGPSTRYGQQLARFFPALLLQPGPWRMEASVAWTRGKYRKELVVTDADGFRSHYPDTGAYRTKAIDQFFAQFADKDRGWTLTEGELPIAVGDKHLVFPDLTLRTAVPAGAGAGQAPREVHVELLGYWRPDALAERLATLDRYGPPNLIVAVSRKLRGAKAGELPDHPRLVPYADVLSVTKVLEAAEGLAAAVPVAIPVAAPTPETPASKPRASRRRARPTDG